MGDFTAALKLLGKKKHQLAVYSTQWGGVEILTRLRQKLEVI